MLQDRADGPRIESYDVAPDGRRFLMYRPIAPGPDEGQRLVLVEQAVTAIR